MRMVLAQACNAVHTTALFVAGICSKPALARHMNARRELPVLRFRLQLNAHRSGLCGARPYRLLEGAAACLLHNRPLLQPSILTAHAGLSCKTPTP